MKAHTFRGVLLMTIVGLAGACASDPASEPRPTTQESGLQTHTGVLRSGFVGIGGESTGWMLDVPDHGKPVEADVMKVIDVARKWEGQKVRVSGRVVTKKYVERGEVRVFVVERIDPLM